MIEEDVAAEAREAITRDVEDRRHHYQHHHHLQQRHDGNPEERHDREQPQQQLTEGELETIKLKEQGNALYNEGRYNEAIALYREAVHVLAHSHPHHRHHHDPDPVPTITTTMGASRIPMDLTTTTSNDDDDNNNNNNNNNTNSNNNEATPTTRITGTSSTMAALAGAAANSNSSAPFLSTTNTNNRHCPIQLRQNKLRCTLHANMAACYLKLRDYYGVVNECRKVLMIDPNHVNALFRRSCAYEALGKFTEALEDLQAAANVSKPNTFDASLKRLQEKIEDARRRRALAAQEAVINKPEVKERVSNITAMLSAREVRGGGKPNYFSKLRAIAPYSLPNDCTAIDHYGARIFCTTFNSDGSRLVTASQDNTIRFYDTHTWTLVRQVAARDIGWAILDIAFSPDERFLIYSSRRSRYLHLISVDSDEIHEALDFKPKSCNFGMFSIKFSPDSREVVAAASDSAVHFYDLERRQLLLRLEDAHKDDVNAISYANTYQADVFYTGSDDRLCKVWDRRLLRSTGAPIVSSCRCCLGTGICKCKPSNNSNCGCCGGGTKHSSSSSSSSSSCGINRPVGCLAGHKRGITHIDSKGDGLHFISNGKDQSIKLWDIRMMTNCSRIPPGIVGKKPHFDICGNDNNCTTNANDLDSVTTMEEFNFCQKQFSKCNIPDLCGGLSSSCGSGSTAAGSGSICRNFDQSLITFRGHCVSDTLIRSYFSPLETTGQNYIVSGSSNGNVYIFDARRASTTSESPESACEGKLVRCIEGYHRGPVRDVAWHPTHPGVLVTSSWDGHLLRFENALLRRDNNNSSNNEEEDDDDGMGGWKKGETGHNITQQQLPISGARG